MQNLRCKSKDVRARSLKALWKMGYKNRVFWLYFWHLLSRLKIVKYAMSYTDMHHWYKFFLNLNLLRLIWGHLCSFQLIYRLTHLSSFRTILSSYRILLNVFRVFWVRLGSFRPILVYLGSFRLIWVHLDSLELIKAHLSSFRLIQTLLGLFRLIWALVGHLCLFELILAQLSLLRFI